MKQREPEFDLVGENGLKLLRVLPEVEYRVSEIRRALQWGFPRTYYHIYFLRDSGFIQETKKETQSLRAKKKKIEKINFYKLTHKGIEALKYFEGMQK